MSDLISLMESEGWGNQDSTTFESSSKKELTNEDFENITKLPARMTEMTLYELVSRYGGPMQLDKWAGILSKLMTANEKEQRIKQTKNELIDKDFVISNVFNYLNIFMEAIFDLAESQTAIIVSTVQADPETAKFKITELRKKGYTKISKEAKKSINDSIKRLKKKYDTDND